MDEKDKKIKETVDKVAVWEPADIYEPLPPSRYSDELPPGDEKRQEADELMAQLRARREQEGLT